MTLKLPLLKCAVFNESFYRLFIVLWDNGFYGMFTPFLRYCNKTSLLQRLTRLYDTSKGKSCFLTKKRIRRHIFSGCLCLYCI